MKKHNKRYTTSQASLNMSRRTGHEFTNHSQRLDAKKDEGLPLDSHLEARSNYGGRKIQRDMSIGVDNQHLAGNHSPIPSDKRRYSHLAEVREQGDTQTTRPPVLFEYELTAVDEARFRNNHEHLYRWLRSKLGREYLRRQCVT